MAKLDPDKVSRWYKQGLWSARMVGDAVTKGVLTETQANTIKMEARGNE